MLNIERTSRFKKDMKLMLKREKDIKKLKSVLLKLVNQEPLEPKHRDHSLTGNYDFSRECHIEPDWLLIYTISNETLRLERTGTHSDLFK